MRLFRVCIVLILCIITHVSAVDMALSRDNLGLSHPLHAEVSFNPSYYGLNWYTNDMNRDGNIDHVFIFDENGYKLYEVMDYDKDGQMDDFYFYRNGVFIRQEIDRNADQRIDLWVYITEGIYVEGYEMDSDYDGLIDVVKIYEDE